MGRSILFNALFQQSKAANKIVKSILSSWVGLRELWRDKYHICIMKVRRLERRYVDTKQLFLRNANNVNNVACNVFGLHIPPEIHKQDSNPRSTSRGSSW